MTASAQHSYHSPATPPVHLCLDCTCFCHDLTYASSGHLVDSRGCQLAQNQVFDLTDHSQTDDFYLAQAVKALDEARQFHRQIAFTGLEQLSLDSQKAALTLAESVHAWILSGCGSTSFDPWALAFAQKGGWLASWTEIRQRSDGLVLWFAPLWRTHPRWIERFSPISPLSSLLSIQHPDEDSTDSGLMDEQIITLEPAHALNFLADFRKTLKQPERDCPDSRIRRLLKMFQQRHWLTWVRSEDPPGLIDPLSTAESITDLIAQTNSPTHRVVMADVPQTLNSQGLKAVLSWRAGLTTPLWFSPEGPVYRPSEFSVDEAEVVIAFGNKPNLKPGQTALWFSPEPAKANPANLIQIPVAKLGFDDAGTIIRADGVALHVPAMSSSRRIRTAEFLNKILHELRSQSRDGGVN